MVSTRHHPKEFPEPATPTTRGSPSAPPSPVSAVTTATSAKTAVAKSPTKRKSAASSSSPSKSASTPAGSGAAGTYRHRPSRIGLIWLAISLPLVAWDTLYVLLRPHTMPGGRLHSPLWTPYALYGTVDYIYGWPAWNERVGFTAAQGTLNVVETLGYAVYAGVVVSQARAAGAGLGRLLSSDGLEVTGRGVAAAVVIYFATAVATVGKTLLYWLNEAFSDFANIGHNSWDRLIFLWVIPNGAWIVLPAYLCWILGKEIVGAMEDGSK